MDDEETLRNSAELMSQTGIVKQDKAQALPEGEKKDKAHATSEDGKSEEAHA